MSFRLKTILGIALIEILLLAILVASTHWHLARSTAEQLERRALASAHLLSTMVADSVIALDLATVDALLANVLEAEQLSYVRVRAPDGFVLAEAGDPVALEAPFTRDKSVEEAARDGRIDVSAPIEVGANSFGLVELGLSTDSYQQTLDDSLRWSLVVAGLEIGLVALLGYLLGAALTRQLAELRDGARRIGEGGLGHQIAVRGGDELAQTAHGFNVMSARLADAQRALDAQKALLRKQVEERTEALEQQTHRLQEALESEQRLNALQRQFVSMVSHEFRTPLSIITGKAQRVERKLARLSDEEPLGAVRAPVADAMGVVRRSVSRLIELIEGVLAASKLEEGEVRFAPRETDLSELILDSAQAAADLFPEHRLEHEVDPRLASAVCDPTLIRQVVSNLLSNAGKYSDAGDVISLRAGLEPDGRSIRISVGDQGVGVPAEEIDQLFTRFFRASTSAGRPGSGIGLHLIKHFVELHGGRVELESTLGVGSTFHVILPGDIEPLAEAA